MSDIDMSQTQRDDDDDKSEIYDPDQDPEVRRELRKNYRLLEGETTDLRNDKNITFGDIEDKINQGNLLFDRVKAPQEASLDSRVFSIAVQLAATQTRSIKPVAGQFDVDDFLGKLLTFLGGRHHATPAGDDSDADEVPEQRDVPLRWDRLARRALARSRRAPAMNLMLGPLSIELKERVPKKRQTQPKEKVEERRPQELTEKDIVQSENETTKNVKAVRDILRRAGRVNLFRLIVNPHDFAQSVENLFYLSFVVRDGRCALRIADDGEPILEPAETPTEDDYANGVKRQQVIMTLDMETWERAIEVFGITEPMIPSRPKARDRQGNEW